MNGLRSERMEQGPKVRPYPRFRAYIDVDGTLVGGHPGLRVYVQLPRWVGFWKARKQGTIL